MIRSSRRGQPLIALGGLLAGWSMVRVLAVAMAPLVPGLPVPDGARAPSSGGVARALAPMPAWKATGPGPRPAGRGEGVVALRLSLTGQVPPHGPLAEQAMRLSLPTVVALVSPSPPGPAVPPTTGKPRERPMLVLSATAPVPPSPVPDPARRVVPVAAARRWSADGWLLLRRGGGSAALAAIGGSYGASQAGAVLRYRLAPADPRRPVLYLRGSGALNGTREQELAFGFSARPVSALPVAAMAEVRATRTASGIRARPATALVTELPVMALPFRLAAEAYAQAGYVGGRDATAFADGQLRVERKLLGKGWTGLSVGGGAWAGAQEGASRVDVGPTASMRFRLTERAGARLSADWRFRVAGSAAPGSGPALSLSAGF